MDAADCKRVLDAWDTGVGGGAPRRARAILQGFASHLDDQQMGSMTLGERDRALLEIRRRLFGDRLTATVPCTECHERLEISLDARSVLEGRRGSPSGAVVVRTPDDITIVARLPTVADLELASGGGDATSAEKIILQRCIESARRASEPLAIEELPAAAVHALGAHLEDADPAANIELEAQCPHCGQPSRYPLDVAAFLWAEVEVEALRLLHDVHRLARGYGWREADILTMSPIRRRAYLALLPI